jgi:hypothetical protein
MIDVNAVDLTPFFDEPVSRWKTHRGIVKFTKELLESKHIKFATLSQVMQYLFIEDVEETFEGYIVYYCTSPLFRNTKNAGEWPEYVAEFFISRENENSEPQSIFKGFREYNPDDVKLQNKSKDEQ